MAEMAAPRHAQQRFRSHRVRQQVGEQYFAGLRRGHIVDVPLSNGPVVIGLGDAVQRNVRGTRPVPSKALLRHGIAVVGRASTFLVDEFRTTCTSPDEPHSYVQAVRTRGRSARQRKADAARDARAARRAAATGVPAPPPRRRAERPISHGVLHDPHNHKHLNRDAAAAGQIRVVLRAWLDGAPRPAHLQRGTPLPRAPREPFQLAAPGELRRGAAAGDDDVDMFAHLRDGVAAFGTAFVDAAAAAVGWLWA
jgi:hypothetical protein